MRWTDKAVDNSIVSLLVEKLAISPFIARLLGINAICDPTEASRFIAPRLADLADPFDISGMDAAVNRIVQAIDQSESILILGDYDVDGITATAIMHHVLSELGASPRFIIPRRESEGYGLSIPVLERGLAVEVPKVLLALDCGTNSSREIGFLTDKGVDVVIVDHHQLKGQLSAQAIFVNPHLEKDQGEPWRNLSAAGLAFKLTHALLKRLRAKGDVRATEFPIKKQLDLVALGTVADLVPLRGENRIFAHRGLHQLSESARPGIHELREVSGLRPGAKLTSTDVAFKMAPRINAGGRLDEAELPANLLTSDNLAESRDLARKLDKLNQERREIERKISEEAHDQVEKHMDDCLGIVAHGDHWHQGVVGIVAGKLSRAHGKPAIVLGGDGEILKGSGRSIPGIDLVQTLKLCSSLLADEDWGGHPAAVGLSLPRKCLTDFQFAFDEAVKKTCQDTLPEATLEIACWIEQNSLGVPLLKELEHLQPFGQENPEPLLGLRNVNLAQAPRAVGQNHFRFSVHNGQELISGIAWNLGHRQPPHDQSLDLAIRLGWNDWNGVVSPQMTLVDWRLAEQ